MKLPIHITTLLFFILLSLASQSQSADSTQKITRTYPSESLSADEEKNDVEMEDDFAPGLAVFALIGIAFMFFCVGAGIVLTILALFILFALVTMGILSTSIIIGIHKKSFAKGFNAFVVLSSAVGGIGLVSAGFWLLNKLFASVSAEVALMSGAALGLLAGVVFGFFACFLIQRLTTFFKQKLFPETNTSLTGLINPE